MLPSPAAAQPALRVIPFPDTPDASPASQIIFSDLVPSELRSVVVSGTTSGTHAGRLHALPHGAGTAFVPYRPFTPGERVSVTANLSSPAAGTAAGAPGATRVSFSFGVEQPVSQSGRLAIQASANPPSGSGSRTMHFRSQPNLHPPAVTASSDIDTSSGDIFLTPHNAFQNGPMILNSQGQLVWFRPLSHMGAFNLEVQRYQGHPVLTWWQGNVSHGQGDGTDVILNRAYRQVAVLHAGNGYTADLHEFQITPQGNALIDAYVPVRADLSSLGGSSSATVWDCVIQELDIKTGRVLWEWHALGHIPLSASYAQVHVQPFDFFHLNSIQQLRDGNLLISARNTWAVYKINRSTGQVMWTLGGKAPSFHLGSTARFEWQHDARLSGGRTLTVFDDAALPQEERESSAKVLRLNPAARTATLVRRYTHSPPVVSGAEGSAERLPNGNMFVGWGTANDFSEYTAAGRQIFNGAFLLGVNSYRAYRFRWQAKPTGKPSLAVAAEAGGNVKVFASWNGATAVASWRVLGGSGAGALGQFGTGPNTGFESTVTVHDQPHLVAVQALDSRGRVLGTSASRPDPAHVTAFSGPEFVNAATGYGQAPAGCFTGKRCHLNLTISSGNQVLVRNGPQSVASRTWALLRFRLSQAARSELEHSSAHRLSGGNTIQTSASHDHASGPVILIPYSVSGPGPPRSASQSPTIHLANTTGFVSSTGMGQILAACYAPARPCHPSATVTSGGVVIATTAPQELGDEELGDLFFQLNAIGQTMLKGATGNQLPAQIKLTDGPHTATGQIALVRYQ